MKNLHAHELSNSNCINAFTYYWYILYLLCPAIDSVTYTTIKSPASLQADS